MPFFLVAEPHPLASDRVAVWATAFPSRAAAAAHARTLAQPCVVLEAPNLSGAVRVAQRWQGAQASLPAGGAPP